MDFAALAQQAARHVELPALAAKVGLPPDVVQMVLGALLKNNAEPGDTVQQASAETGVPEDKVAAILQQLGGAGALGKLGGLTGSLPGGLGGLAGGLGGMFGKK